MWFVLAIAILATFAYYYNKRDYWKRRGVPGPPSQMVFGNLWAVTDRDDPYTGKDGQIERWTKEYGRVYGFQEGVRNVLVTSDLHMLHEVFIKQFDNFHERKLGPILYDTDVSPRAHVFDAKGARWKRLRSTANPNFSVNALKKMHWVVEDSARTTVDLLSRAVDDSNDGAVEITRFFEEYTLDVIRRVAMGQDGSMQFETDVAKLLRTHFNRDFRKPLDVLAYTVPFLRPAIYRVWQYAAAHSKDVTFPELYRIVGKAIQDRVLERKETEAAGDEKPEARDFIDLFLDTVVDEVNSSEIGGRTIVSRQLTMEEIMGQCFVFLLAGFDTTAISLSYVSWQLSRHPDAQTKLMQEIDEHCTQDDVSYETLSKLKYLDSVIKEGLRMHPLGAFAVSRKAAVDTEVCGMQIEKGTYIMADVLSVHYDTALWGEDANQFRPERWDSPSPRHVMSQMYFGAGPRLCVGYRLAQMEEKLVLVHLLRRYTLSTGHKTEKSLRLRGSLTVSADAVHVYFSPRP